jgi:hypothetical protein
MIRRPARVRIRIRKPWVFFRWRLFGWYVRFIGTPAGGERPSGRASQYSDEPSTQVNAAAVEKAVKTAFRPTGR